MRTNFAQVFGFVTLVGAFADGKPWNTVITSTVTAPATVYPSSSGSVINATTITSSASPAYPTSTFAGVCTTVTVTANSSAFPSGSAIPTFIGGNSTFGGGATTIYSSIGAAPTTVYSSVASGTTIYSTIAGGTTVVSSIYPGSTSVVSSIFPGATSIVTSVFPGGTSAVSSIHPHGTPAITSYFPNATYSASTVVINGTSTIFANATAIPTTVTLPSSSATAYPNCTVTVIVLPSGTASYNGTALAQQGNVNKNGVLPVLGKNMAGTFVAGALGAMGMAMV